MPDTIFRHFFAGFVRLHILYHADKEPVCGVDIIEELKHHGYDLSPGTLYPILHGLAEADYLTVETAVVRGKQRKNYRITDKGRRVLHEARQKLRELVSEVIEDRDAMAEARRTQRDKRSK